MANSLGEDMDAMMGKGISSRKPPRWEVVSLIATHLDPNTLAVASCVSKTWSLALSSDRLWRPLCITHFPSISSAFVTANEENPVPYRRLYSVALKAKKSRVKALPKPRLSLCDLSFTINLKGTNFDVAVMRRDWERLQSYSEGLFRFDVDISDNGASLKSRALDGNIIDDQQQEVIGVVWNVVWRGWEAVFTMVEAEARVTRSSGSEVAEGWVSEELPAPECCAVGQGGTGSGVVADVKVRLGGSGEGGSSCRRVMSVERVSVGILSVVNWRYVSVEDGLRYLQHFLLPCQ